MQLAGPVEQHAAADTALTGATAATIERQAPELVEQIMAIARRELGSLANASDDVIARCTEVADAEVELIASTLRDPSSLLPAELRAAYRREGEWFADRGLPLADLTRMFECANRVLIPLVLESVTTVSPGQSVILTRFLQSAIHRSAAAVSIVSRAFIDRTEELVGERTRLRESIVADLVFGEMSDGLRARALAFGLSSTAYEVLVINAGDQPDEQVVERAVRERFPDVWCGRFGAQLAAIAPVQARNRRQIRELTQAIADDLATSMAPSVIVAHGRPAVALEGIRPAYLESESIAKAASAVGLVGLVSDRDVKIARVTMGAPHVGAELDRLIEPLERFAGREGDALMVSLRAFIDADLSILGAANALNVHRNTMSYRIDVIEQLLGSSIKDLRLPLKLALLRRELRSPAREGGTGDD